MTHRSRIQNRVELLGTCAMIAAAIAIAHGSQSFAQSVPMAFQGTPTVSSGAAFVSRGGPSGGAAAVDTISLNSSSAIINWNTFDQTTNTPIDFLPQNTIGRFQSFAQDFTVLNRVFAATPGQAISINGTVQSQNFQGQTTGNIWFYSPGGIIAGPTAVFNVGNLILTANDIDTTGGVPSIADGIHFSSASGSTSAITVMPGAKFNLPGAGSYLALVAPQVVMGGTATVNGSTAYIAAERVNVRINNGLFDINFQTGTDVTNALTHTGVTTGPGSANGTIILAAMPKNAAITMLVGGTLGYTPAATATVENGTVVLSAGANIFANGLYQDADSATPANITIGTSNFTSSVSAQATNIFASPTGPGSLTFAGNVNFNTLDSAEIRAEAGETVSIGGNLILTSGRQSRAANTPSIGGKARLAVDGVGGSVTVGGATAMDTGATGYSDGETFGGNGIGGTSEIFVRSGTMLLGAVNISADGTGGVGPNHTGDGTGGIARVHVEQSRNTGLTTGAMTISAVGTGGGGGNRYGYSLVGGNGLGGQALLELVNNGSASVGNLEITSVGLGGGGANGGNGTGGAAQILVNGGSAASNAVDISAGGFGTYGSNRSGNGTGGTARVHVEQSQNTGLAAGNLTISASGSSGLGGEGGNQDVSSLIGGNGTGGKALFELANNGVAGIGNLTITADASGGGGGIGGDASAGTAQIDMGTGRLDALETNITADEVGGSASSGGKTGSTLGTGIARVSTRSGQIQLSNLFMTADAYSAVPGNDSPGGQIPKKALANTGLTSDAPFGPATEGAIRAGTAEVLADRGTITTYDGSISASASAFGQYYSSATTAGAVTGGKVNVIATNNGSISSTGLYLFANAYGTGASSTSGNATGGRITLMGDSGGSFFLDPTDEQSDITLDAHAEGTIGVVPASGSGGIIDISLNNASIQGVSNFTANANGYAGSSVTGGAGSSGTGGRVDFGMSGNARIAADSINLTADGASLSELDYSVGPGAGGAGVGGTVNATLNGGTITTDAFAISASGRGAFAFVDAGMPATTAGSGSGGTATLTIDGTTLNADTITVYALGSGGFGGDGRDTSDNKPLSGTGSNASFQAGSTSANPSGNSNISLATAGGNGTGGTATLQLSSGSVFTNSVEVAASGTGGEGGFGYGTDGAAGGAGTGGIATFRNLPGSIIVTNRIDVYAHGIGGEGGSSYSSYGSQPESYNGGNGGLGRGGTALIDWQGDTQVQSPFFPSLGAYSYGEGGDGGDGYDNETTLSGRHGGQGGDAFGGNSSILITGLSTKFPNIDALAYAYGGTGGEGNTALRGGDAIGGHAEVIVTDAALVAGYINIASQAASFGSSDGQFGSGARGSDATGGTSLFEVSGPSASYVIAQGSQFNLYSGPALSMNATADASSAANGADGTTGTAGGRGGNAIGGQVTVQALNGLIDLTDARYLDFRVGATGGNGGNGGNATTYQPAGGGAGGDAGNGTGGTILFRAEGGQILGDDLSLTANGTAGMAGYGGHDTGRPGVPAVPASPGVPAVPAVPEIAPAFGPYGQFALGNGGSVALEMATDFGSGLDGRIALTSLSATTRGMTSGYGDYGSAGTFSLSNETAGGATLQLGSLTVDNGPIDGPYSGSVNISANNAPIHVDGDINIVGSGNANLESIGTGSITAGGIFSLNTQGYLNVYQFGGTGPALKAQTVSLTSGFGIDTSNALIVAENDITVSSAYGSISTGAMTAGDDIRITGTQGISTGALTTITSGTDDEGDGHNIAITTPETLLATTLNAAGSVNVRAIRGVNIGTARSTALTQIAADEGVIVGTAASTSGDVLITTLRGNAVVGTATAGRDLTVTARFSNASIANASTAGRNLRLVGGGATSFTQLNSTGTTFIQGGTGVTGGGASSGTTMSVTTTAGNIVFTNLVAGTSLTATAPGTISGSSAQANNGTLGLTGNSGIDVATVRATGGINLIATGGPVRVSNDIGGSKVNATGRSILLRSLGNLSTGTLLATAGNVDVRSSGTLTADDTQASGTVTLTSTGADVIVDRIGSGGQQPLVPASATISARTNASVGTAIVTGALSVQAIGLATLSGQLRGSTIAVQSGDIAIGATAQIGTLGTTTSVSLTNIANTQTIVGGSGTGTGAYRLGDAELQRVFANNISIIAAPSSQNDASTGQTSLALTPTVAPDLIVDSFTLSGGTNLGANGTLLIQTRGKMQVTGTVTLNGMTTTNRLQLTAVTAIEALPTSSIVMRGTNGLAGTLGMTAEDIIASSPAALTDVAAATTLTAAGDRLGANNSTASDGGYFQAGGIIVTVSKGIYVQNTGTGTTTGNRDYALRRGFTVGSGGFTVVQASSTAVRVAINGRQVSETTTAAGTSSASGFVTGIDMVPLIKFVPFGQQSGTTFSVPATGATTAQQQQAAAIFDPLSTVNGCTIISAASCQTTTVNDPTRDVLEDDFGLLKTTNLLPLSIVQLKDYVTPGDQPLIDEPVTGAANDDLWSVDDSTKCDPAKEVCK